MHALLVFSLMNDIRNLTDAAPGKRRIRKVSGYVPQKDNPFKKFAGMFFEEDFKTVRNGLFYEVIIPTIKGFIADIFIQGLERALWGTSSAKTRSRTDYTRASRSSLVRDAVQPETETKERFSFTDVVMQDRSSAQDLLDSLREAIKEYGSVSVNDLYDALDRSDNQDFVNVHWGWKNLDDVQIKRTRTGWWVDLPKPVSLR